jgi:hypothetical protein
MRMANSDSTMLILFMIYSVKELTIQLCEILLLHNLQY